MKELSYIYPHPPADLDPAQLDATRIPEHVALIMDGNGRWAKARGKQRLAGHKAGIEAVRESIRMASDVGIRYLTIYSFSSENWKRPLEEVSGLMNLFAVTMLAELEGLHEEQVRIMTIGDLSALPQKTREAFEQALGKTKNNEGMTLVIAVNYGSRAEILKAAQAYADHALACAQTGEAVRPLDEEAFAKLLYTAAIPDPDLLIRTSGEMRISNFLLWQLAYTEIYCTPVLWPDFDRYEFLRALLDFQNRNRRFGAVNS